MKKKVSLCFLYIAYLDLDIVSFIMMWIFFQAEADSIVTLQPFRDKCEPIFLFSVVSIIFIMSNVLSDSNL